MSESAQLALIAMIGTTLALAIAGVVKIYADAKKKDEQLKSIHVLVNSRLTDALHEIADLKKTIASLLPKDLGAVQNAVDAAKAAGDPPLKVQT